jgi:hypothetical protein
MRRRRVDQPPGGTCRSQPGEPGAPGAPGEENGGQLTDRVERRGECLPGRGEQLASR